MLGGVASGLKAVSPTMARTDASTSSVRDARQMEFARTLARFGLTTATGEPVGILRPLRGAVVFAVASITIKKEPLSP